MIYDIITGGNSFHRVDISGLKAIIVVITTSSADCPELLMLLHSTEAPEVHDKMAPEYVAAMEPPALHPFFLHIGW